MKVTGIHFITNFMRSVVHRRRRLLLLLGFAVAAVHIWLKRKRLRDNGTKLSGRVVLITGASGGLGKLIAHGCALKGANLVLADISEQACSTCALSDMGYAPQLATLKRTCVCRLWV